MNKKVFLVGVAAVGLVTGWALFRPERLWINQTVSEALPVSMAQASMQPTLVASGAFHAVSHETEGKAMIYETSDGKRVLRFTDFKTSNGPDVQVYLVGAPDATDNDTVRRAGFVTLGGLKGNIGDQNYELPPDVDLSKYRSVTIWCRRFGVNFATAPLSQS